MGYMTDEQIEDLKATKNLGRLPFKFYKRKPSKKAVARLIRHQNKECTSLDYLRGDKQFNKGD